jgi:hypothetical protein
MAGYVFESITDAQAASFGTNDYLFFSTDGASARNVTVAPYSSTSGVLSGTGITLTFNGVSHTFNNNISAASGNTGANAATAQDHILFSDNSHLLIGTASSTGDTLVPSTTNESGTGNNSGGGGTATGTINDPYTVYALSGDDTINFTNSAGNVGNYLNGGFGADTIMGGAASNHIYGNSQFAQQGATQNGQADGADTITVTTGSNYINGNAGADIITVGVNAAGNGTNNNTVGSTTNAAASTGFNRVFGGADNDTITVQGAGHAAVNGNTGNDIINDTGFGDNTLRGGSGDDIIHGGSGHSVLMGDVGNDTIFVHGRNGETAPGGTATATTIQQHISVLTGGNGADTFDFTGSQTTTNATTGAATTTANAGAGQAALFGQTVYYQEITDFTIGTDKITLPVGTNSTALSNGNVGHSSTIFSSVHDAEVYAQSQLSGNGNQGNTPLIESLAVGSANNTYLFYNETGNVAVNNSEVAGLGIIHLDNVTAANVSYTDFNAAGQAGS